MSETLFWNDALVGLLNPDCFLMGSGENILVSRSSLDNKDGFFKDYGTNCFIRFENNGPKLFETTSRTIFDSTTEPLMEIFMKLFSTVSSDDLNLIHYVVDYQPFEIYFKAARDDFNCSPIELAFFALLFRDGRLQVLLSPIADLVDIVKDHAEKFHATTFDTVDKVMLALHPWSAQLGVDGFFLISRLELNAVQIEQARNPKVADVMKRLALIHSGYLTDDSRGVAMFSTVSSDPFNEVFSGDERNGFCYALESIPFHHQPFLSKIEELRTYQVLTIIENPIPSSLRDEQFMEFFEHLSFSAEISHNAETRKNELKVLAASVVLAMGELAKDKDVREQVEQMITENPDVPGFVKLAVDYFLYHCATSEDVERLWNIYFEMSQPDQWEAKWTKDFSAVDFILHKIHNSMTAKSVIECIRFFEHNNESLTTAEWLGYAERYEEFEHVPFSWLVSMLKD